MEWLGRCWTALLEFVANLIGPLRTMAWVGSGVLPTADGINVEPLPNQRYIVIQSSVNGWYDYTCLWKASPSFLLQPLTALSFCKFIGIWELYLGPTFLLLFKVIQDLLKYSFQSLRLLTRRPTCNCSVHDNIHEGVTPSNYGLINASRPGNIHGVLSTNSR